MSKENKKINDQGEDKKTFNAKPYTKDEIDSIIKYTDEKLTDFIKSGKYKDVLLMMGNLYKYSFLNQMYISLQKPDATTVYGLKGWNLQGRSVMTGQKAIKIIAPIIETTYEGKVDETGDPVLDEDGKQIQNESKSVVGYKPAYVFDLSQTKGKDLEVFKINKDTVVENKDIILQSLKDCMHEKGYTVNFVPEDKLPKGCEGVCNIKNNTINIKSGMSDLETVSTLIHECAHALAHSAKRQDFEGLTYKDIQKIEEVEAESIALVVASKFGLDTENFNLSYIAGWSDADITKFRKNIDVIRFNSAKLIEAIDGGIQKSKKKEKESEKDLKPENTADSKKKSAKEKSAINEMAI